MYKRERGRNVRDYLHIVLHCVFRHLFTSANIDRRCWDLACDIAVESAIEDLHLESAACNRAYAQEETLKELRSQVRLLTAEKLYRYFLDRQLSDDQMARLRDPFLADDHRAWYLPEERQAPEEAASPTAGHRTTRHPGKQNVRPGRPGQPGPAPKSGTERRDRDLEQTWREISERLQVDLETISRRHGTDAGNLVQELKAVNRETYDYADFLRRYMSLGEVTQVNQDEFDYIYYTYGLSLYGNMPLVEPLEYKEVRRIKEFVIAIDTSGSVSGDLVQRFVTKTYNILRQQENFFTKINLHIIQCDAEVQEDRKITSQKDFDNYLDTMQLHGFGGTDFRPVFQYVDELVRAGEFTNLKGMIYFTDGRGIFPEKKPDYDAAFGFSGRRVRPAGRAGVGHQAGITERGDLNHGNTVECLRLEGRRAVVQPEGPVARVSAKAVPALRGVEILVIPPDVDAFYGLNRFENLRIVEYGGTADVFAFQDSLDWLSEKLADEEAFLFRLATNAIGARPISPALTAIAAPRMRPIHAMVHWDCLMAALDERAANGTVRQDTSRENIFLCQGYAQLKRLEYAFYLGFSLEEEGYAPEIGACYRQEDRFTGEERLIYALALLRGHSYQEFYTNGGTNDFRHMRPKEHYLEHLRRNLALTDNDALRRQLLQLADLGFLDQDNCRAAVDLLLRSRLTEATAFLLDYCNRRWPRETAGADTDFLDAEFAL